MIEVVCTLPTRVNRENIRAALTVGVIQAQLNHACRYEFPENVWEVVTDVGASDEEDPLPYAQGNVQYKLGEYGERLWSFIITEENKNLLMAVQEWKKMVQPNVCTEEPFLQTL